MHILDLGFPGGSDIKESACNAVGRGLIPGSGRFSVEGNGSPEQIGRVSVWDGTISPILHQNHIIKARFGNGTILPGFAMYYFMTRDGREQILSNAATTSGLYTLSLSKIASFYIPAPPLAAQEAFMATVSQFDKSKFSVQIAIYRDVRRSSRKPQRMDYKTSTYTGFM